MQPRSAQDKPCRYMQQGFGSKYNVNLLSFINVNVCKANLIHIALIVVNVISREFGRV